MKRDHRPIVHTVYMVAGEDEHIIIAPLHNEVQILVDSVSRALVPFRLLVPSIRLEQANAALLPVQIPGLTNADMIVQRVGTILCQYSNISNPKFTALAQAKLNDP